MTINELLGLIKIVKVRASELRSLRSQISTKESWSYSDNREKYVEPQYDVKAVDRKITELETFIFKADSAIKQSNAVTKIDIDAQVDNLLAPLQ